MINRTMWTASRFLGAALVTMAVAFACSDTEQIAADSDRSVADTNDTPGAAAPDLTRRVLREWNGVQDDTLARDIIARGAWLPRKPYACVAGLRKTIELFPELGTERFTAEDFYDNSIMEEIDASGFLDDLYL